LRLINPSGYRKMTWDFISGVAIIYSIVEVPFQIAFQPQSSAAAEIVNSIVDAVFFVDIILAFNTAFIDPATDLLVTNRYSIWIKYASLWLWIDMASTIPFDQIAEAASSGANPSHIATLRLIRVLRLVRLVKLIKITSSKRLKDWIDEMQISPAIISLSTLLLQIFMMAHIICCFWFYITTVDVLGIKQPDQDSGDSFAVRTWAIEFGVEYESVDTQYIASLYWAFATMLTVGYGDIHATNTVERFYAFITMLIGSLMFGAIIAKIRMLVESRNLSSREIKVRIAEFKSYLEERPVPTALKLEVKVC
jgi:hypothetical protein